MSVKKKAKVKTSYIIQKFHDVWDLWFDWGTHAKLKQDAIAELEEAKRLSKRERFRIVKRTEEVVG